MIHKKTKISIALLLAILILGFAPITVYASTAPDVVLGNNYTLGSGQTLNDDLLIMGGNVILEKGSTVNGTVILLGGNIRAAGTVTGEMVVLGGAVDLADSFILDGNLSTAGATVNRAPGAQIRGEYYTENGRPNVFTFPGIIQLDNLRNQNQPWLGVAGFFLRLFFWVLVAMLLAMFIPNNLTRVSQTAFAEPVAATGIGFLTLIVAPIVIILLAITICLIPVALLVSFVLAVAWAFGLIALGFEVGRRISASSNRPWHPALVAGLGTLLLMLVLNGLEAVIPCVGWIPKVLIGLFALGAVLLTQFGAKPYPLAPVIPSQITPGDLPTASPEDTSPVVSPRDIP
jgi:hypothetical protein